MATKKKRKNGKSTKERVEDQSNSTEDNHEIDLQFTIMRRFHIVREDDPNGMSGVGIVGEGVQFTDGTCAYRFINTEFRIESIADNIHQVEALHSHLFKDPTRIEWIDPKQGRNDEE